MGNPKPLAILEQGVTVWNTWRQKKTSKANLPKADLTALDLSGVNLKDADLKEAVLRGARLKNADLSFANLKGARLGEADLTEANLTEANLAETFLKYATLNGATLPKANLYKANLSFAKLRGANVSDAHLNLALLYKTDLRGANLRGANLRWAIMNETDLTGADLTKANLEGATLIQTKLEGADLTGCRVYGASVWNVGLSNAKQASLIVTPESEPEITVDNLEVAQFIYLMLNNERIRHVIETITSKVVLILGRFTPERKVVLDAVREHLRTRDYLPIVFDFPQPDRRTLTETITLLARMARFVIADITDARSIPQELMAIIPNLPSVPVQPLLLASQQEYGMFESFKPYPWVLPTYEYTDQQTLLNCLEAQVIMPAEQKANELQKRQS